MQPKKKEFCFNAQIWIQDIWTPWRPFQQVRWGLEYRSLQGIWKTRIWYDMKWCTMIWEMFLCLHQTVSCFSSCVSKVLQQLFRRFGTPKIQWPQNFFGFCLAAKGRPKPQKPGGGSSCRRLGRWNYWSGWFKGSCLWVASIRSSDLIRIPISLGREIFLIKLEQPARVNWSLLKRSSLS